MVHGLPDSPEAGKNETAKLLAGDGRTGGVGGKIVLLGVVGVELAHIGVGAAVQIVGPIRQAAQRRKAVSLGAACGGQGRCGVAPADDAAFIIGGKARQNNGAVPGSRWSWHPRHRKP